MGVDPLLKNLIEGAGCIQVHAHKLGKEEPEPKISYSIILITNRLISAMKFAVRTALAGVSVKHQNWSDMLLPMI